MHSLPEEQLFIAGILSLGFGKLAAGACSVWETNYNSYSVSWHDTPVIKPEGCLNRVPVTFKLYITAAKMLSAHNWWSMGFRFAQMTLVCRAADAFSTPAFATMRERCIVQELGWDKPARKWQSVLEELWLTPPSSVPRWPVSQVNVKGPHC